MIEKKRMQQRYGSQAEFDANKDKLLPNEFAVVTSGADTDDGTTLYLKIGDNEPKRMIFDGELYNNAQIDGKLELAEKVKNKVSIKEKIKDTDTNYPSIEFLDNYYYPYEDVDNLLKNKADKSTSLAGYNIIDAYTKNECNLAFEKLENKTNDVDIMGDGALLQQQYISGIALRNYHDKYTDKKYDKSNIENGTATLTPYQGQEAYFKSSTVNYQKVGNAVTYNINIVFNAFEWKYTNIKFLLNLPFATKVNSDFLCVTDKKQMLKAQATSSAWLKISIPDNVNYTIVDGTTLSINMNILTN